MRERKVIKVAIPCIGKEEIEEVKKVLKSGYYISGPRVEKFEGEFAEYIGTKYGVAVNSGTAAIHLALSALGIGLNDEVIVPALTFFSTVTAVIHNNSTPVFADIDSDIYCLDPKSFREQITERTKAVIPVHLYGHPAEMDSINKIAKKHGIYVIEDCAQAHGAIYKKYKVGGIGDVGCWSFFATKNMTTGEGGMITTNYKNTAYRANKMRSHGLINRNDHVMLGYNYRMTEIGGAIGSIQLRKLDDFNSMRHRISMYIRKKIKNIPWLRVPPIKPYVHHAFFWCPIQIKEDVIGMSTWDLRSELKKRGLETRHRYNEPLYRQPLFRNHEFLINRPNSYEWKKRAERYKSMKLPNVEEIAGKMLGLPNHPMMANDEVRKVIKILKEF